MKPTLTVIIACLLSISLWAQDLKQFEGPNGSYGYKDIQGNIVIAPKYQKAFDFKDGLAIVVSNDKWGYIDNTGKVIVEQKYDELHWFSEDYAVANYGATKGELSYAIGGKYGYVDKTGKEVIPFIYDKAGSFNEGIAPVNVGATRGTYSVIGGKWGYIDKTGKEIIPFIYDLAGPVSDGLAMVGQNGKNGFIDKTGKIVIPLKYDNAGSFKEGLARVKQNGKFGYISPLDEVIIPFNFDDADPDFSNGLACVKQNGLYGFIDNTGKIVIPLKYENANPFRINRAGVKSGGKWGYIDTLGKIVIDAKYDYAGMFVDGKAKVKLSGEEFSITPNGQRYNDAQTTVAKNKTQKATKEQTDDKPDFIKRMKERDELLKSMDKNYKGSDISAVEKSYQDIKNASENYVKAEKESAELTKLANGYAAKGNTAEEKKLKWMDDMYLVASKGALSIENKSGKVLLPFSATGLSQGTLVYSADGDIIKMGLASDKTSDYISMPAGKYKLLDSIKTANYFANIPIILELNPYNSMSADYKFYFDVEFTPEFDYKKDIHLPGDNCPVCDGEGQKNDGYDVISNTITYDRLVKDGKTTITRKNYLANERVDASGRVYTPTYEQSYDNYKKVKETVTSKSYIKKYKPCPLCNGAKKYRTGYVVWDEDRKEYVLKSLTF